MTGRSTVVYCFRTRCPCLRLRLYCRIYRHQQRAPGVCPRHYFVFNYLYLIWLARYPDEETYNKL